MEDLNTATGPSETTTEAPQSTTTTPVNDDAPPSFGDGGSDPLTDALSKRFDELSSSDEPRAQRAEDTTDQPEKEAPETAEDGHPPQSIEPPNSWSADAKAKWSAIPPDLQTVIAERERQAHEQITRQGEIVSQYESVTSYLEQAYPGQDHAGMLTNLVNAQAIMDTDPVGGLKWLAESYGIDLAKQFGAQPGSEDDFSFNDPRVDTLNTQLQQTQSELRKAQQYIQQLGGFVETQQRQQFEVRQTETAQAIETASKEHPYFNDLYNEIVAEVEFIRGRNPNMPAREVLDKAYNRAVNNSDVYRAKMEQDRKQKEAEEAAKAAAKAAQKNAGNVRSTTSSGKPVSTGLEDPDFLSSAYDRIVAGP